MSGDDAERGRIHAHGARAQELGLDHGERVRLAHAEIEDRRREERLLGGADEDAGGERGGQDPLELGRAVLAELLVVGGLLVGVREDPERPAELALHELDELLVLRRAERLHVLHALAKTAVDRPRVEVVLVHAEDLVEVRTLDLVRDREELVPAGPPHELIPGPRRRATSVRRAEISPFSRAPTRSIVACAALPVPTSTAATWTSPSSSYS